MNIKVPFYNYFICTSTKFDKNSENFIQMGQEDIITNGIGFKVQVSKVKVNLGLGLTDTLDLKMWPQLSRCASVSMIVVSGLI